MVIYSEKNLKLNPRTRYLKLYQEIHASKMRYFILVRILSKGNYSLKLFFERYQSGVNNKNFRCLKKHHPKDSFYDKIIKKGKK